MTSIPTPPPAPALSSVGPSLPANGDHVSIERSEYDGLDAKVEFFRGSFFDVGFKSAVFRGGTLRHCRFERCYFRRAQFRGVDLTGTTFINCNLGHASFDSCKLDYVMFEDCQVEYESIVQNLPAQPNLKRHLLRSLRINAAGRGDVQERDLLLMELRAERDELYATFCGANEYFRQKPVRERVKAFGSWTVHEFQKYVWGYGLQLRILLRSALVVVALGAWLTFSMAPSFKVGDQGVRHLTFGESLLVALGSFTTVGPLDIIPTNVAGRVIVVGESLCGAAFLGLLAATAYRKIAR